MDKENNQENDSKENPESGSLEEDTRRWLLELENPELEDTQPIDQNEEPAPGDPDKSPLEPEADDILASDLEISEDEESALPDWLGELTTDDSELLPQHMKEINPEEDPEPQRPNFGLLNEMQYEENPSQENEEIEIKTDRIDDYDEVSENVDSEPTAEADFIDISEADLTETDPNEQPTEEEGMEDQSDLPDWLREMITESEDMIEDNADEVSSEEQMPVTDSTKLTESSTDRHRAMDHTEEFDETPEIVDEHVWTDDSLPPVYEPEMDVHEQREETIESLEGDVSQGFDVTDQELEKDDQVTSIHEEESSPGMVEMGETDALPETLLFAKQLVGQDKINDALEIFNIYIEKGMYLEEIQSWMDQVVIQEEAASPEVWETIGDLALRQNHPEDAFDAYTRAIGFLLNGIR